MFRRFICRALFIASIIPTGWAVPVRAQSTPVDNTAANKTPDKTSADKQGMSASDTDITRRIRKAVIADKTLSTYAHNVKIITIDGLVTLKGPVRSAQEKASIESMAIGIAGQSKVINQITIAPDKSQDKPAQKENN